MVGHPHLMERALLEATRAAGKTRPNPMVGCVVARGRDIIAVAHHRRAGHAHAEILALRRAGAAARGSDVYVTLEPCSHVGRTGPCADALIAAGIRRIFVGGRDPNPQVHGRGLRRLRAAGIVVHTGLLGARCRGINQSFYYAMTNRRPEVTAKIAQSLDGKVATAAGESKWITSPQARAHGRALRAQHDAIMVGIGTMLADDPHLGARGAQGPDPLVVIVDTHGRTPLDAKVLRRTSTAGGATLICHGPQLSPGRRGALRGAGATLIACPLAPAGGLALPVLLTRLWQYGIQTLLVEGGPTLHGGMLAAKLVNRVLIFMAPCLLGGAAAPGSIGGVGVRKLIERHALRNLRLTSLSPDLLMTADLVCPARPARQRRIGSVGAL